MAQPLEEKRRGRGMLRTVGLGLITGAADDHPSAIGTYASAARRSGLLFSGAAYDLCQVVGWKHSLHAKPSEAKKFYAAIAAFTVLAMSMNFLGFNPMKALVFRESSRVSRRHRCGC